MGSMHLVDTLEQLLAQFKDAFRYIKSPQQVYEQQVEGLNASIEELWKELYTNPPLDHASQIRAKIVRHGGDLKELEMIYQASANQNQKMYDQAVQELTRRLYKDLLATIGLPTVGSLIHELRGEGGENAVAGVSGMRIETGLDGVDTARVERSEPESSQNPALSNNIEGTESSTPQEKSPVPGPNRRRKRCHTDESALNNPSRQNGKRQRGGRESRNTVDTRQHHDRIPYGKPAPGEIYLAYWQKSKERSAVLVLPTKNLEEVGIPDTLEDLGLLDDLPSCYTYCQHTKQLKWARGYEDDGDLAAERKYPVMYFHGPKFPDRSAVGWVAVDDLQVFNLETTQPSLIPYYKSVRDYLRKREAQNLEDVIEAATDTPVAQKSTKLESVVSKATIADKLPVNTTVPDEPTINGPLFDETKGDNSLADKPISDRPRFDEEMVHEHVVVTPHLDETAVEDLLDESTMDGPAVHESETEEIAVHEHEVNKSSIEEHKGDRAMADEFVVDQIEVVGFVAESIPDWSSIAANLSESVMADESMENKPEARNFQNDKTTTCETSMASTEVNPQPPAGLEMTVNSKSSQKLPEAEPEPVSQNASNPPELGSQRVCTKYVAALFKDVSCDDPENIIERSSNSLEEGEILADENHEDETGFAEDRHGHSNIIDVDLQHVLTEAFERTRVEVTAAEAKPEASASRDTASEEGRSAVQTINVPGGGISLPQAQSTTALPDHTPSSKFQGTMWANGLPQPRSWTSTGVLPSLLTPQQTAVASHSHSENSTPVASSNCHLPPIIPPNRTTNWIPRPTSHWVKTAPPVTGGMPHVRNGSQMPKASPSSNHATGKEEVSWARPPPCPPVPHTGFRRDKEKWTSELPQHIRARMVRATGKESLQTGAEALRNYHTGRYLCPFCSRLPGFERVKRLQNHLCNNHGG